MKKKVDLTYFKGGFILDEPDSRDYQWASRFGATALPTEALPESFSWRAKCPPLPKQQSINSCFKGDTPILMEDFSYKPISEVSIGEFVISHRGQKHKVIKTFKRFWQGTTKILKIWGDYREIECTCEHPFLAIKRPTRPRLLHGVKKYLKNYHYLNTEVFLKNEPIDFH